MSQLWYHISFWPFFFVFLNLDKAREKTKKNQLINKGKMKQTPLKKNQYNIMSGLIWRFWVQINYFLSVINYEISPHFRLNLIKFGPLLDGIKKIRNLVNPSKLTIHSSKLRPNIKRKRILMNKLIINSKLKTTWYKRYIMSDDILGF